ncbi:MAG: Ig-like domain-containing protein [Paludibacteraceae bacterium]
MKKIDFKSSIYFLALWTALSFGMTAHSATRQMEYLDRGVVAVKTSDGVFVSWRALGTESLSLGFNLYRDGTLLNSSPITTKTNYVDAGGSTSSKYVVKAVLNGVETDASEAAPVWATFYKSIQLKRPAAASNSSGSYTDTPNDCSVGDVDGDGQYELIVKWDPSNSKDNSQKGYTGNVYLDCYKLDGTFLWRIDLGVNIRAGAHYTQFQVYDYDGDGKAEVACKTAPGTKDGKGTYVLMGSDDASKDYRNSSGYVLSGPEYLTMFNGETGAAMSTVAYNPARGTVSSWGDSYGNRVDRFLACTAYLDGVHPSLVVCRGYYTRSTLTAYDFKNGKLVQRWYHNSATKGSGAYAEGFHNLSVADVDKDGYDEIIYGSATIDHDGSLYSRTGYGHGDAMHVSKMVAGDDDFYGWFVHEEKTSSYGYELRNLRTNKVKFGLKTGTDNGRGCAADIDPNNAGFECWSTYDGNVYNTSGASVGSRYSVNFRVYWDGDLQDELLDGTKISKFNTGSKKMVDVIDFSGYESSASCNTTKATPCLSADLFGDWREEVILYNSNDPSKITIFTTTTPSDYRLYTPMHDAVYRMGVAWQNTAYNQPPHLGIYIGGGVSNITLPDITMVGNPNKKPTISITSPKSGAEYIAPASVNFTVSAADVDGSVKLVEYYNGSTKIGQSTASPFSFTWENVAMGTYSISAKATDDVGNSQTSSSVTVVVNRLPSKYVYVYDNSGDLAWSHTGSWTPAGEPISIDTTVIRMGEVKADGLTQKAPMFVEPDGIFRLIADCSVSSLTMQGGTVKVYTSNPMFTLTANMMVETSSTLMAGSVDATIFNLQGSLSGSGDLTKTSVGILSVGANAAAYTGLWRVSEGELRIAAANAIGQGGVEVGQGASLDVDVAASTFALSLNVGSKLNLDANLTVQEAAIGTDVLTNGKYTAADYPDFITGSDTLIVDKLYPFIQKQGAGGSKQTVDINTPIVDYGYAWQNAVTVEVVWSPETPVGITVVVDDAARKVGFSGTPTVAGVYSYTISTVSNSDSVYAKSGVLTVVDPESTGLISASVGVSFSVYPNPVASDAYFTLFSSDAQMCEIALFDLEGTEILRDGQILKPGQNEGSLNVEGLSPGIYLMQMKMTCGVFWTKIIKQ